MPHQHNPKQLKTNGNPLTAIFTQTPNKRLILSKLTQIHNREEINQHSPNASRDITTRKTLHTHYNRGEGALSNRRSKANNSRAR